MAELGWGWSLGGTGVQAGGGGISTMATGGNRGDGGGGTSGGSVVQDGGSATLPADGSGSSFVNQGKHPWLTDLGRGGDNIWMGGGGYPGQGGGDVGNPDRIRYAQNYGPTQPAYLSPATSPATGYGGGGGGGGGAGGSTANGQKVIFNDKNNTWSLYDPNSKAANKWSDGISTKDIYGKLTGNLKDLNPEWYYGASATSAMDAKQYQYDRQTNMYENYGNQGNQTTKYGSYGL